MAKRRFRNKPRKLSGFISGSLHPNVLRRMKVTEIDHHWIEVVGSLLAGKSYVSGLDENQLVVMASSSSVAQQIKMRAGTIMKRIKAIWNIELGGIKVFVGKERKKPPTQGTRAEWGIIKPSSLEVDQEMDILQNRIEDNELARSIASLKATYRKRFGNREKKSN